MTTTTQTDPLRQEIEQYAYHLYEQRGCEPGHELDDWLEAEKQLMSSGSDAAKTYSAPAPVGEQQSHSRQSGHQKRTGHKAQRMDDY